MSTGLTECLNISSTEYIYPNTCNNITCNYEKAIDRITTYSVIQTNGNIIFVKNINQKIFPSKHCLLDSSTPCNEIGSCWCDPNGFSTRICYNHTSGGEGQLTLRCALSDGPRNEKLATIAGNCFFYIYKLHKQT